MSFPSPDPACIRIWGEEFTHRPGAGGEDVVKLIRCEDQPGQADNCLITLFGTMADSGFRVVPVNDDLMIVDGETFRVYDVKKDWAGGTATTAGLWLHLDQAPE